MCVPCGLVAFPSSDVRDGVSDGSTCAAAIASAPSGEGSVLERGCWGCEIRERADSSSYPPLQLLCLLSYRLQSAAIPHQQKDCCQPSLPSLLLKHLPHFPAL